MFNPEDFREFISLIPLVNNLNKYLNKNKAEKISKIIEDLEELTQNEELAIPITYIFSILAEKDIKLIPVNLIKKLEPFLNSDDKKLQLNTIIIIGFFILNNPQSINSYLPNFMEIITQDSGEILENAYFFLQQLVDTNPLLLCSYKSAILECLKAEKDEKNQLSLLKFIESCDNFDFDGMYQFREVASAIISQYSEKKDSMVCTILIAKISQLFPIIQDIYNKDSDFKILSKEISNLLLMKRYNFTTIEKEKGIKLKDYIQERRKSPLYDIKVSFYIHNPDENLIYFYEIEKARLNTFFERANKISGDLILKSFSQILENDSELKLFMKTLVKLNIIKGYFSELNYFYPYTYLREIILKDVQEKGLVNFDNYNYIPPEFLQNIMQDLSESTKQVFLIGKNNKIFYSLKKINQNINIVAAKKSSIDLNSYHERLIDEGFLKLIESIPKEYLSPFHKGTQYLTNLGLLNVKKEIENSKIIGYFSLSEVSSKLKVNKLILFDVLGENVDMRSGIFDENRNNFYYSKFLNEKIEKVNLIKDEIEKNETISQLAKKLNINKNIILSKLDENLKSIGEEIKIRDFIDINEYLDKTGMDYDEFLHFVRDLGIPYFKKGDRIIINQDRINEAKNDIKSILINKAKSEDFISLGDLDLTLSIVKELLLELQEAEKIIGIFYNDGDKLIFYTRKGIENLMLENQQLFSFQDFFFEKQLSESELQILRSILDDLIKSKRLKGIFDEENLVFSSNEVLFAQNYNSTLSEFEKIIKKYFEYFESEFQKIKKILIKKGDTILPQEIKIIQEIIIKINSNYVHWRSGLEAFIRKTNIQLLKKQGLSLKNYKFMILLPDKRKDIKLFEEDPEVVDLLNGFKEWVRTFNNIELKYGNVIFYQKRLITNPNNAEDSKKLEILLAQLKLINN